MSIEPQGEACWLCASRQQASCAVPVLMRGCRMRNQRPRKQSCASVSATEACADICKDTVLPSLVYLVCVSVYEGLWQISVVLFAMLVLLLCMPFSVQGRAYFAVNLAVLFLFAAISSHQSYVSPPFRSNSYPIFPFCNGNTVWLDPMWLCVGVSSESLRKQMAASAHKVVLASEGQFMVLPRSG